MARSAIFVCLPLLVLSCGGGTAGPVGSTGTPSPEPTGPGGREKGGGGPEPAVGGREAPPASQDPGSPTQEPPTCVGGGGGTSTCIKCDAAFICNGTVSGQVLKDANLALKTSNGVCILDGQSTTDVFLCNGKITVDGKDAGTWKTSGAGFSFSGQGLSLDCQPAPVATPGK